MVKEPMPAISSYVGYSLEEPWGQPRVVFGMAAGDAEQLAALLNRHDCIGPVHAAVAMQGEGADAASGPGGLVGLPPAVPPPAPAENTEQQALAEPRTRWPTPPGRRVRNQSDEPDGPVYRQVVAAAREAAARDAAVRDDAEMDAEVA